MKKALSILCLLLLLNVVIAHGGAKEPGTLITVKVAGVDGQAMPQAYVSLWNHSTTPSTMVNSAHTNFEGVAVFAQPKSLDKHGQGVHLSVMVSAPGYETGAWHWSVEQTNQSVATARTGNALSESVSITLRRPTRNIGIEGQAVEQIIPMFTPPGTIRHRLVWWDDSTYANRLTTVATINQVGYLQSSFTFSTNISTRLEVKRRVDLGVWQSAGEVTRGRQLGSGVGFGWTIPASGNDAIFRQRACQTQYDYRLEEYVIEQYQDNGDTWVWVRIGTENKFYARQLNPNATAAGYINTHSAAPPATWVGNRIGPRADQTKSTFEMDEIERGFSATVLFMPLNLSVRHTTNTESVWKVYNSSDTRSYERGIGENRSWVWRP